MYSITREYYLFRKDRRDPSQSPTLSDPSLALSLVYYYPNPFASRVFVCFYIPRRLSHLSIMRAKAPTHFVFSLIILV